MTAERTTLTVLNFGVGVMATDDFEQWVYATPELEQLLGEECYLNLIEFDFRDRNAVANLRQDICFEVLGITEEEYLQMKGLALCSRLLDGTLDADAVEDFLYRYVDDYGAIPYDPRNPLERIKLELLKVEHLPDREALPDIQSTVRSAVMELENVRRSIVERIRSDA